MSAFLCRLSIIVTSAPEVFDVVFFSHPRFSSPLYTSLFSFVGVDHHLSGIAEGYYIIRRSFFRSSFVLRKRRTQRRLIERKVLFLSYSALIINLMWVAMLYFEVLSVCVCVCIVLSDKSQRNINHNTRAPKISRMQRGPLLYSIYTRCSVISISKTTQITSENSLQVRGT